MSDKKALVLTYHVKNCSRVGGFHRFIDFLCQDSYDVDWVTLTVSVSWLFKKNDRENAKNFFDLWRGIDFERFGSHVRHFGPPIWVPAKIARMFKLELGKYYWPKWGKIRKKLLDHYDVILVEGIACQYAEDLKRDFPNSRLLYRPSDILRMFSDVPDPDGLEKKMIGVADATLCVDETGLNYYKRIAGQNARIDILRNPITTEKDIQTAREFKPVIENKKTVVYVGVSYFDVSLVEYAASLNKEALFIMIGPLNGKTHDNIVYTGALSESEYSEQLKKASVGISPLNPEMIHKEKGIAVGYTRKIINYMKYLMPVVATCSTNYFKVGGFFCVDSKDEFANKIAECLTFTLDDREKLREQYLFVLEAFSEGKSKERFLEYVRRKPSAYFE